MDVKVTDVKERTEAAADTSQCPVRRFPLNQPEGHKAPVPRYSAAVKAKVAVLFLGLQNEGRRAAGRRPERISRAHRQGNRRAGLCRSGDLYRSARLS